MITELEIRRSRPAVTLEPLDLVLALFDARGEEITILQVGACDGVNNDPIYHHVVTIANRSQFRLVGLMQARDSASHAAPSFVPR